MNERQKLQLEKMKNTMSLRGGKCLSDNYINNHTKMELRCNYGHIWKTTYHSIVNNNKWCPECNINKQKGNINDIIKIVKDKGGYLLTKKYKNSRHLFKVKCSKGHTWSARGGNLTAGSWCKRCASIDHRLTEKDKIEGFNIISKIVKNKSGICLSHPEKYETILSKLKFKCSKDHEWEATASCIKNNKWCPICNQGLSEKLFRYILETIFNYKFSSCHPEWLKSEIGFKLEIDGYNKDLKFGFEYQGKHHFEFSSHFHKTQKRFKRRLSLDRQKKNVLYSRNIFMLYPTYELNKEDYFDYIKSQTINTPYEKLANFDQKVDINNIYKII